MKRPQRKTQIIVGGVVLLALLYVYVRKQRPAEAAPESLPSPSSYGGGVGGGGGSSTPAPASATPTAPMPSQPHQPNTITVMRRARIAAFTNLAEREGVSPAKAVRAAREDR